MRHVRLGGQHKSCYDTVEVNFSIACEKSSQLCILFVLFWLSSSFRPTCNRGRWKSTKDDAMGEITKHIATG